MNRRLIFGVGLGVGLVALAAVVCQRQCTRHQARAEGARPARARGKRFLDDVQAIRDNTDRILEALAETRSREHMATA